jgi:hypothetical protein
MQQPPTDIALNLAQVRQTIADAAASAGRDPADITLIAVSKTQPPAAIVDALAAGQQAFGENTVQDALTKAPLFPQAQWHFIGHLQSNKAKHIPGQFAWLHTLDSVALAQRLARLMPSDIAPLNVLLEVNVTRDPRKHGVLPDALPPLLESLLEANLPTLALRGLMTIGPYPADDAQTRAAFAHLRALRDAARTQFALPHFTELSMGMSTDYVQAIQEGATMLRIGSAIFGARPKKPA